MLKNNRGVTLLALIITVVIMMILSGISITTGYSFVKNTRIGRIISNMMLVQAKAESIYEEVQFSGSLSQLGDKINGEIAINEDEKIWIMERIQNSSNYDAQDNSFDKLEWYRWNKETLKEQGLNPDMLGETEYYYVNYKYGEIIYSTGTAVTIKSNGNKNKQYYYSLTGLTNVYGEEAD